MQSVTKRPASSPAIIIISSALLSPYIHIHQRETSPSPTIALRSSRVAKMVELVQRLQRHVAAEDVPVDPVGKRLLQLVAHVHASRHRKDVVEFFKGALLRLGDPEEDHDQGGNIEATRTVLDGGAL